MEVVYIITEWISMACVRCDNGMAAVYQINSDYFNDCCKVR